MDPSNAEFARQWTATFPKVSAFVGSMVHDRNDRDDVLQDCAVAAMTSFERYDPERDFAGWAIGVARNQVRLYIRRKSKDPLLFDDDALDSLVQAFARVKKEESKKLTHLDYCIDQLEGRARQLCESRYSRDLKPAQIGKQIGMSANGVSKALQRIREQLRECIERQPSQSR